MKSLPIALLLPVLLLVGCSREAEDWRSAQAADTPEAYAQFLQQHADSAQTATAKTRMEQLAEERDWQIASSEDSSAAYQNFVTQHPEGKWAQEARIRVENFTLNAGTPTVTPSGPLVSEETPAEASTPSAAAAVAGPHPGNPPRPAVAATPKSAPVKPAPKPVVAATKPSVASSGGYGVQLGAFTNEAAAQAQWKTLAAKYKSELAGQTHRVSPRKSGNSHIYRLQVARASEQQARDLCTRLKAKGQSCVVVLP